ncbi:hypothetical protein Tco_0163704 [Tanacetum coccineum]
MELVVRRLIDSVSMGCRPIFSANAVGTESKASVKALMAYCTRLVSSCSTNSSSSYCDTNVTWAKSTDHTLFIRLE